jgi:hypothetical protein
MEIKMKKQLIAAAVASSVSAVALADISITGNAKYEYFNTQTTGSANTNQANTEVNLGFKGKTGDTTVVLNLEFNSSGAVDANTESTHTITTVTESRTSDNVVGSGPTGHGSTLVSTSTVSSTTQASANGYLDIEDMYMTTKVGDINVKAGNWVSGAGSLGGEIDDDTRGKNKVDLRTTISGVTLYAGNNGISETAGNSTYNNNMYAGAIFNVAGNKIEINMVDEYTDSYGFNGSVAGFNYRL